MSHSIEKNPKMYQLNSFSEIFSFPCSNVRCLQCVQIHIFCNHTTPMPIAVYVLLPRRRRRLELPIIMVNLTFNFEH